MIRYGKIASLLGSLMLLCGGNSKPQVDGDLPWPMFCHDVYHTGLTTLTGQMDTRYVLWSYTTNGQIFSSPALGDIDGNGDIEVVIGSDDNYIYALNGEDGSYLWSYPSGSNTYSSPALGDIDGNGDIEVVIGSSNGNVYALNGQGGNLLWLYTTGGVIYSSPAIGDIDGNGDIEVVIGSWDNSVYALNGQDGSLLWSYPTADGVRSSPVIGDIDGNGDIEVVIGSWDNSIYALNGQDGSLFWSYPTADGVRSSPSLGDIDGDGILEVVVGSQDNNVYALNGEDGSYLWSYTTGNNIHGTPALGDIDGDNNLEVVIGSLDNNIYALNGEDGSFVWSYTANFGIWASSALGDIDGDGYLEVLVGSGTSDNNIYALNGEDGSYLWSYTTGDGVAASPALGDIDGDGNLDVVIGSEDDNIYALSDEPTPPIPFNLIAPPDSVLLAIPRPTFIWEQSYDSLSGLRDYEIYINDTLRHTTIDTTWIADFDLTEGYHDWHVVAYDSASNPRQSNQTWTIFIDTTGPLIESTTVWHDTSFAGPFPVETKATEISTVDTVVLFFKRTQDTTWLTTGMSPSGSDWYYGEIPQVAQANDTVRYYIYARDILQNESTDPTGAPTYYYSFAAYSTGVYEFVQSHQPFIFEIKHNPSVNRAVFSVVVSKDEQVALFVYDIVGRLIDKLTIGTDQAGRNEISWAPRINSGVYFYSVHSHGQQETGKFVLLK